MKVQSLSINIPTNGCLNRCKFCVSRLHGHNQYEYGGVDFDRDLRTRLQYAREEGCNTVILTGQGEVLQSVNSVKYLESFFEVNQQNKGETVSPAEREINEWIQFNMLSESNDRIMSIQSLKEYILDEGSPLYRLPFGAMLYSVKGMSIVLDDDCMSKAEYKDALKYYVLRENCKLYTRWDDDGSLVF